MIKKLVEELAKDKTEGSCYHGWQANIAMAFKDEYNRAMEVSGARVLNRGQIHTVANEAARNFLDTLIKTAH